MTRRTTPRWPVSRSPAAERGSVSIEAAIVLGTVIVTFFSLMISAGRVMSQQAQVRTAAHAAAREASLHDSYGDALAAARGTATANLADAGVVCQNQVVSVDGADFVPGGYITIRVGCTASLIPVFGSSTNTYSYAATEVIDEYRGEP